MLYQTVVTVAGQFVDLPTRQQQSIV